MIKLKNLLSEELTDKDIKVGDAHKTSGRGLEVNFVYGRKYNGWETLDYQFKTTIRYTWIYGRWSWTS